MVEHDDDIGFSRTNEVSMSLEDEGAGAEDQERQLLELVDSVRFAVVCKELQQVAKLYNCTKQRWVSKPKLLPMLMLPPNESDNDAKQRLLYSVLERKIYNNISICLTMPYNEMFCGSTQGWLASALRSTTVEAPEKRKSKLVHEITLRNPFGKALEENYYVLFALFRPLATRIGYTNGYSPPLALIKGGQESWMTIKRLSPDLHKFDDVIFHKNKVCLLLERGYRMGLGSDIVESTNGDLLLVLRFYAFKETSFGVCKIVFNEEDKSRVHLVEVKCIGDDAIFLGQSQSHSVLASSAPGCKPNCIYYATESVKRNEYPHSLEYLKSEMGIFNLGDRTRTTLIDSDSISNWNWNELGPANIGS
ncbi:hypothetical protein ACLB2K_008858 [Fragaria x ananassa]